MAKLAKFEEVDFGNDGFLRGKGIANAILKAVSAVGENSKLQVLSIPGFDYEPPAALAEARKILTVNMVGLSIVLRPDNDDDDDDEDEDEDD